MAENGLDSSQPHLHLNPRASYILHQTLQRRWHISLYDLIIFLINLHHYTPKELTEYRSGDYSEPVGEQHCPPAPVDGTIELLYPALLSPVINSQIKAVTTTVQPPHTGFLCIPSCLHPPSSRSSDGCACLQNYL